jgi:hypothetical protein
MTRTSNLPAIVPVRRGSTFYSADNIHDIMALATRLRCLDQTVKCHVAGHMVGMGVMVLPLFMRLCVRFGAWRSKSSQSHVLIAIYCRNKSGHKLASALIESAAEWAISGMDMESSTSVGGFSQREINFISGCIDATHESLREGGAL